MGYHWCDNNIAIFVCFEYFVVCTCRCAYLLRRLIKYSVHVLQSYRPTVAWVSKNNVSKNCADICMWSWWRDMYVAELAVQTGGGDWQRYHCHALTLAVKRRRIVDAGLAMRLQLGQRNGKLGGRTVHLIVVFYVCLMTLAVFCGCCCAGQTLLFFSLPTSLFRTSRLTLQPQISCHDQQTVPRTTVVISDGAKARGSVLKK